MLCHPFLRRAAVCGAVAIAGALVPVAASAQTPGPVAAVAATPSPPSAAAAVRTAICRVTTEQVRFDVPLVRTARLLANGEPIKIVALGSSSTYGAGASTSAASYPSRLAEELARYFPGHEITVLNRGVNGDEAADML